MASKAAALGALLYETETNFGETTTTTGTRLRPIGDVTYDLQHPGQRIDIVRQRPNEGVPYVRMPMAGSISATYNITGLNATTASAPPASALATFLGTVFGTTAASHSTPLTISGGTATAPTATSATSIASGSLVRIGAKKDTRNDGQWIPIGVPASTNLNPLVGLMAAPSAADVIYCSRVIHGSQTTGTYETLQSLRMRFQTAQQQYLCHGCYPTAAEFNFMPGSIPTIKVTHAISWWEPVTGTFPSATAVEDHSTSPIAGGTMAVQAVGTIARTDVTARSFSFTIGLNNMAEMGVGGYDEHQIVVGCNRGPTTLAVEMVVDSETAGTDTFGNLFDVDEYSRINRQIMYSMSTGDGRSAALYFPNAAMVDKPVQFDDGGVLMKRLRFEPQTGTTTTTDLTMSPWRLALG